MAVKYLCTAGSDWRTIGTSLERFTGEARHALPPKNVETLILRFRDLVTPPGGTLERHRVIIATRAYVWWGWWNKFGERVPVDTFTRLRQQPFDLFLFDSGSNHVFGARCDAITWDQETHAATHSPEPDATPEYYTDQQYLAWFRLSAIEGDVRPDEILHEYAYEEVAEFFESGRSTYTAFYGKRIESPRELNEQNRTIWFGNWLASSRLY